ncbi:MAG: alpha-E domain-containing protein, partial [Planctomycetaceae bacterium]
VPALQLRRSPSALPSRAADYLCWRGRLTERAEGAIRHLRGIVARLTTEVEPAGLPEMRLLVTALCDPGQSPLELQNPPPDWTMIREELWSFLSDFNRPGSLAETLDSARRTASVVRDRVAIDAWRILNQMELGDVRNEGATDPARLLMRLNQLLILCSAFSGLAAESMTRGPGWLFLDMGRRIERGLHTLRVIRGLLVDSSVELLPCLEAMLEIADSSMTYRYRYLSTLQLAPVLDLILVDETNPRSVIFQMIALGEHARRLEELCPSRPGEPSRLRQTYELLSELRLADIEALCDVDRRQDRESLARRLEEWSAALRGLSEDITHAFLSHTVAPRQLTELQTANRG